MRRIGHLWDELTSFENLYRAAMKARRGKRSRPAVEHFDFELERRLVELRQALREHCYEPGPFRTFRVQDPKPRLISAAPYIDRVVHHAWCNVVEPIFERSFIFDSYACRVGKGTHAAVDRYQHFSRRRAWVLKCDIRKFFPSIDHAILLDLLARKIKDREVLWLAKKIIDHSNPQDDVPGFFPGDDLLTTQERRRGLPIGNQTSQFFANVYLNSLDHFVKEQLHCRAYVRYCDDFVILDDDPGRLTERRDRIEQFLVSLRLWLHPTKRVVSRTADGVRFLGYRIWPSLRRLPAANVWRFRRRLRVLQHWFESGLISPAEIRQCVAAWIGHAQHANTIRLQKAILGSTIFAGRAANVSRVARWFLEQQSEERPLR